MAKALKIESGRYLNMDHVVTFSLANGTIEVTSTIQAFTSIHIGIKGKTDYADYFVSIQEFHRIKRELCDYMGIDEPTLIVD
ncbi:hypothetical protein [Vibrio campbellii]|uniref:Uncharacterized protein n=2 Tax=Vibrio campbellii TaxID=680 RepID=A7N2X6_VIBC1|nr:hypothetical protein [Vibrio campbellii]ABU72846.1 hypothetical protein VIBHAR_04938 [Vibrio campbellii ATCC BAA-1116]AGU97994.1 hypothetical protein M892_26475 [Vibrio campbellii ATCC BAA-1116]MBT0123862.1 hypothetical protein [Vibrio campbellii]MBT0138835.1 hypothetical protein [Vibrio campbellii]MBT0143513.1 hypothetical protein [Vibrio campbellii]